MANAVVISNISVAGSLQGLSMGANGSDYITNTTNLDGAAAGVTWGIITCITAATFTLLTSSTTSLNGAVPGTGNMNAVTLVAGQTIFGRFTSITLTGGSIIAYRNAQ